MARSSALLQALEVGTCRLAGRFDEFERAATTWQAGQHQPDRLAALVVGHDVLVHSIGQGWDFAVPGEQGGSVTPIGGAWWEQRLA